MESSATRQVAGEPFCDAARCQPGGDGQVDEDREPESELERDLDRLVPELVLGDKPAGPPADQVHEVQRGFWSAAVALACGGLVQAVHDVGNDAAQNVGRGQGHWQAAEPDADRYGGEKAERDDDSWNPPRAPGLPRPLPSEANGLCVEAALRVFDCVIGDQIALCRPPRPRLKCLDVHESPIASAVRDDEPESFRVLPVGNVPDQSHGIPCWRPTIMAQPDPCRARLSISCTSSCAACLRPAIRWSVPGGAG